MKKYRFNLEIFEDQGEKIIKFKNIPFELFRETIDNIERKLK